MFASCVLCAVVAAGGHASLHGAHGLVSELVAGARVAGVLHGLCEHRSQSVHLCGHERELQKRFQVADASPRGRRQQG